MDRYPMKLTYVTKNIIWGGKRLADRYNKVSDSDKIAESWELTVRDDGMSFIENGVYSGISMREYIDKYPCAVSKYFNGGEFPLLIKFIDAEGDLSIQVHPNDEYAAHNEDSLGKTEMWYITEADENAAIIYGTDDEVSEDNLKKSILGNFSESLLKKITVHKGESYFIPAGQIHAICRGVLIAEIQQNSNITYRIYDYDRCDANGNPRQLHKTNAADTVRIFSQDEIREKTFSSNPKRRKDLAIGEVLCDSEYFRVTNIKAYGNAAFTVDEMSFAALLFTDAENTTVFSCGTELNVSRGDCIFIPAGSGEVTLSGNFNVLISEV